MKRFTLIFCFAFFIIFPLDLFSQNVLSFSEQDLKTELNNSKAQSKPVFLMIYATWCSHCNKMKKKVFTEPEVMSFFTANYIPVWADGESDSGRKLKEIYSIKSYPAFIMLNPDGKVLYKLSGEFSSRELLSEAANALIIQRQLPYLEKQFNADPGNADKCLSYITTLLKGKNRKELAVPTHKYLATQTDEQLLTETNWRIISNGVSDINSREFQYVLKNKIRFEKLTSKVRVDRKIENIVNEYLTTYLENPDVSEYIKKRQLVKDIDLPATNALLFKYDLRVAEVAEDWKFYDLTVINDVKSIAWDDASQLKEIAQTYLDKFNDTTRLIKGTEIMDRSLELSDTYDGRILLSKMYKKAGMRDKAIVAAKNAKKIAGKMGWDAKEADAILNE